MSAPGDVVASSVDQASEPGTDEQGDTESESQPRVDPRPRGMPRGREAVEKAGAYDRPAY